MEAKTELQRNALDQVRRKELGQYQLAVDVQWLNSRMEDGRMGRCLAQIDREAGMESEFHRRSDHAAIVNDLAKRETALGKEIAEVKMAEETKLQRRHYLREKDPSLRVLAKKLQAAYVCRDQRKQILNNEYKKRQDKEEEKIVNDGFLNTSYLIKEETERGERRDFDRKLTYSRDVRQQCCDNERVKRRQRQDAMRSDKKMLEDAKKAVADEDARKMQHKHLEKLRMQREMTEAMQAREEWRAKVAAELVQEAARIEKQARAVADRTSSIIAAREEKYRKKEELNQRIVAKTQAEEAAVQKHKDLVKLLEEQELLEKNVLGDIAQYNKREQTKQEIKGALFHQFRLRKDAATQQRAHEAGYRQMVEEKLNAEDMKQREKERKLNARNRQYGLDLRQQIRDNAVRRKHDHDVNESRAQYVKDYDKSWLGEVAEERKRMIRDHAPQLLGFMQAGVLKHQDLPNVREAANRRPELASMDIESMACSNRPRRFQKCNAQCNILREY